MNEKLRVALLFTLPWLLYLSSSLLVTRQYLQSSFERYKFCVEQTKENNISINVCSHIVSASDSAFSWATSYYNPIIILLIIVIISLGFKMLKIDKELKEVKETLNV